MTHVHGRVYVTKLIAQAVKRAIEARTVSGRSAIDGLTRRQREVLQLLAEGRQAKKSPVN